MRRKLVHAHASYCKGSVLSGLFSHLNLPEPTLQVHAREVPGTNHAFHGLLHMWQGVGILLHPGVAVTEVDTKPERSILLPHQHHGIAPWQLGGSDGAAVQHLLNMLAYLVHQWWGNTTEPFLEWFVLHELNDMLCGVRASNFIGFQGEDMMELQQQGYSLSSQLRWPFFKTIQPTVLLEGGEEEVLSLLSRQFSRFWFVRVFVVQFLRRSGEHWASGTALAATTQPMTCPLARWMGWAVRFCSTTETLLLPSLSSVYVLMTYNLLGRLALSSG